MRTKILIVVTLLATLISPAATTAEPDTLAKKAVSDNVVVANVQGELNTQVGLTQDQIAQKQIEENLQKIEEQQQAEQAAAQKATADAAAAAQAAEAAREAQIAAQRVVLASSNDNSVAVAYGRQANAATFGDEQWPALYQLWSNESGWRANAENYSSGACGIPQFIGGCTLGDYQGQINLGLGYIKNRYGTPENALAFWNAHRWY